MRATGHVARAGLVLVGIGAAVAAWRWRARDEFALPAAITLTEVLAELAPSIDRAAVRTERPDDPVRAGELEPGEPLRGAGLRPAVVAPPPARIHWQVAATDPTALLFSVGVDGRKRREAGRSALRFTVTIDGRQVYRRVVDPAATNRDRQWFDERIALAPGRAPREVMLATDAVQPDLPLAGTAGWSRVRLVREAPRARQPARPGAPNVVVLLVDTLRADRLGCYGARPSPSPTLDALAARGLRFTQAVAQASWTLPSVASLMSGLHPRSHGAVRDRRAAADDVAAGTSTLADSIRTWAEEATRAGVTTVGVSTNPVVSRATNLAQGFETFVELPWDRTRRDWTPATEVNRVFLRWLARNRSQRFVAYLHYMEPHDPYTPPAAWRPSPPPALAPDLVAGWVRDLANRVNWHGADLLPPPAVDYLRALYDGEIRAWDAALHTLLAGLAAAGVRDSTVVVVTADHGEEFQEHGRLTHGSQLYDESIHVPLVFAGPGIAAAERADVAQGIDLFPTLAALLGLEVPPGLPGRDLLATRVDTPAISETARGIAPGGASMDMVAVRTARWKLIRVPQPPHVELYDLAADPGEHADRHGTASATALEDVLARWEGSVQPPPPLGLPDPGFADKLRALGYVE